EVLSEATAARNAEMYWWAKAAELYAATHRATPPAELESATDLAPPAGVLAGFVAAMRTWFEAHAESRTDGEASAVESDRHVSLAVAIARCVGGSRHALVRGDFAAAIVLAARGVDLAREHGLALWEADARIALCDGTLCLEPEMLPGRVRELSELVAPF